MARPSNTEERRAQIVTGLRRVLARQGYAGATVLDIARAARLAPGLVHYHFEDKRAVLLALVEELAATLRARLDHLDGGASTARARLHAFVDAALALGPGADADLVACWVGISAEAVRDPEVREVLARATLPLVAELRDRITHALVEAGAPRRRARADAASLGAVLWSAMQGAFVVASTAPEVIPPGAMAPALCALVDRLLVPADKEAA